MEREETGRLFSYLSNPDFLFQRNAVTQGTKTKRQTERILTRENTTRELNYFSECNFHEREQVDPKKF